jgi:hypothetical protein
VWGEALTTSPAHPFLGPGSICLLCDSTVADELTPPACVAPLRCYCPEHRRPKPPPAAESIQAAQDALARRRALVEAGFTRNQRAIIAAQERNAQ